MTTRHVLKIVQHGQTQQQKIVQPGAGLQGQAVVVKATGDTRYQLTDIVTQTSPGKLQVKRVGKDLHVSLPGGDVQAPDLVVDGYFEVPNASLWGVSGTGEWLSYDTAGLASAETAAAAKAQTLALQAPTLGWLPTYDSPWGIGGIVGGVAVLAAAAGGGGGDSSSGTTTTTSAEDTIKNYASAPTSSTAPTLANYSSYGVKAYASLSDTSEASRINLTDKNLSAAVASNMLTALNSAIAKMGSANITEAKVQAAADAYFRILSEADGNVSVNTDVYNDTTRDAANASAYNDPTAADYASIGVSVGSTTQSLALLNDAIGRLKAGAVDTVDEVNALARAAENVMLLAKGATTGATGGPAVYATDAEWINGLSLLMDGSSGVTASNLAEIKALIDATANDGTGVDTIAEIKTLIAPVLALPILKSFTDDTAAIGSKTAATPTIANYKDVGVQAWTSLSDTTRVDLDNAAVSSFLTATTLNSYLDNLASSAVSKTTVQAMVDGLYRILKEADGNTTTDTDVYPADATPEDPSVADYAAVGITVADLSSDTAGVNENLNLLNDALGRLSSTAVDTSAKLKDLHATTQDVMKLAAGQAATQADTALITGLNTLMGLTTSTGVNSDNLAAFKTALAAKANDGSETDTVAKLLGVMGQARLMAFTDDTAAIGSKTAATPTLANWSDIGLTANTSLIDGVRVELSKAAYWTSTNAFNGLVALNSALDTYAGAAITQTLLQDIVDAYGRILQEADGAWATATDVSLVRAGGEADAVITDLTKIGVANLTTRSGELLASTLGNQLSTAVDTVAELNTLATAANNVINRAEGTAMATGAYTTEGEWITGINSLLRLNTSNGVNTSNVTDITTAITDAVGIGVDSYVELQALVSMVRLNDYAKQKTGWTLPTITDYAAILAKESGTAVFADANSSYLNAYNSAIDYQTSVTDGQKVESMVSSYNTILGLADGNRSAPTKTPVSDDYDNVLFGAAGASGVTGAGAGTSTYLLNDIINGLTITKVDSISELNGLIATVQKIQSLAGSAAATDTLTRDELTNIGLTDGNGHTPSDIYSGNTYWISDAEWQNFQTTQLKGVAGGFASADTWQELQKMMDKAIIAA